MNPCMNDLVSSFVCASFLGLQPKDNHVVLLGGSDRADNVRMSPIAVPEKIRIPNTSMRPIMIVANNAPKSANPTMTAAKINAV